jgi:hypothetical protein
MKRSSLLSIAAFIARCGHKLHAHGFGGDRGDFTTPASAPTAITAAITAASMSAASIPALSMDRAGSTGVLRPAPRAARRSASAHSVRPNEVTSIAMNKPPQGLDTTERTQPPAPPGVPTSSHITKRRITP